MTFRPYSVSNATELLGLFCTRSDAIFAQQTSGTSWHIPSALIPCVGSSGTVDSQEEIPPQHRNTPIDPCGEMIENMVILKLKFYLLPASYRWI